MMPQLIPKGWIKYSQRDNVEYKQGVRFFMDFAMKHSPPGLTTCICPCKKCKNRKRASFEVVKRHLILNGMLSTYDDWSLHGEKPGMILTECPKQHFVEVDQIHDEFLGEDNDANGGVLGNLVDDADSIADVFGANKKSRCRAISSTFSAKQAKVRKATKAIANQNTNLVFAKRLDNIEGLVREVLSFITTIYQPQNPMFGCDTPRTEGSSNSVHPMIPRNFSPVLDSPVSPVVAGNNGGLAPRGKEYVVLLGRAREDVAKGFIASQSTCHGREVQDDEKIVWVTEVIKPESPVFDGPQNGVTYLCEIADGGYLIWGSKRIRYL